MAKKRGSRKKAVSKGAGKRKTTARRTGVTRASSAGSRKRHTTNTNPTSGDFGIQPAEAWRRACRGEDLSRTREQSHRAGRAGSGNVPRESGVGAPDDGPGSHSGGDVSPDFTGVGTNGGVAESGADAHLRNRGGGATPAE